MKVHSKLRVVSLGAAVALSALAACSSEVGVDEPPATDVVAEPDVMVGELFTGPDGQYTITIGTNWAELPSPGPGVTAWSIGEGIDGFIPNVNVLTQDVPGIDLASYMESSVDNIGTFELLSDTTMTGRNGNEIGMLEYQGTPPGAPSDLQLHFLAAIDVRDGVASVATLTATEANFDRFRSENDQFLTTLQTT